MDAAEPRHLIAVDPSFSGVFAWAVFNISADSLLQYGSVKYPKGKSAHSELLVASEKFKTIFQLYPNSYLVCEDQWLGVNALAFKRLVYISGFIAGIAQAHGVIVEPPVAPATWQTAMLRCRRTSKREERKALSMRAVQLRRKVDVYDLQGSTDIADAINIGDYWLSERRWRLRIEKASA